jgi:hypothetical protein
MPEIKNSSVTDLQLGKTVQPSELPTPAAPESAIPKAVAAKPGSATATKRSPKPVQR